ncbi:MAG TPA: hypothetical protein VGE13_00375 [Candidatus Saccharimonadales bacterium]
MFEITDEKERQAFLKAVHIFLASQLLYLAAGEPPEDTYGKVDLTYEDEIATFYVVGVHMPHDSPVATLEEPDGGMTIDVAISPF